MRIERFEGYEEFKKAIAAKGRVEMDNEDQTEPPEFDDEEGISGGPEEALKPAVIASFKSWLAAHKGKKPNKGMEWTEPESETETAAQFAVRAAEFFADTDEGKDAADAIGEGPDFEDWVAAVMRYEGADSEVTKSLAAAVLEADEMCKALSKDATLSADEAQQVLQIRLMNQGESWGKCARRTNPQAGCNCPVGYCGPAPEEAKTIDEYADKCADSAISSLMWESSPVIKVMRKLGGVAKYHDWTREQILAGYEASKKGEDAIHAAVGAETEEQARKNAGIDAVEVPVL